MKQHTAGFVVCLMALGLIGGIKVCGEEKQAAPKIAGMPLTICCDVDTVASDGVILSQGGDSYGYALYLKSGRPVFSLRTKDALASARANAKEKGELTSITASRTVSGRFSLRATLDRDGTMAVFVNGEKVAEGKAPGLITTQPKDGLVIGQDTHTPVGEYRVPHALNGTVTNVKITIG